MGSQFHLKKKKKQNHTCIYIYVQWKPHNSNCMGMDYTFELRVFEFTKMGITESKTR